MQKVNTRPSLGIPEILAILVVGYSAYLALAFAQQPPLDIHAFRQAQTALTSYWFAQEGLQLAYATPVAGFPWSIPFEFPLYQGIVAVIAETFGVPMDATGRLVGYAFLLLCLPPVYSITRRLTLPAAVFPFFVALTFSTPLYIYWGRSFMIETAALFFSVAAIKYLLDYLLGQRRVASLLLFSVFATLAVLQKSTTVVPVLMVLSLTLWISEMRRVGSVLPSAWFKPVAFGAVFFAVPLAIGVAWIVFTDQVKLQNMLGQYLTSAKLSAWNWGTWAQRMSSDLWVGVAWQRMFVQNLGSMLGLVLLLLPMVVGEKRLKRIALATIAMGISPLVLFTNLHYQHNYYQTANQIFLAFAVALSLGAIVGPRFGRKVAIAALLLVVGHNYWQFHHSYYLGAMQEEFNKNHQIVAVGDVLRRELPTDSAFVAFGHDWSSALTYMAERKSFTVPTWMPGYPNAVAAPERLLPDGMMGALVSCSSGPTAAEMLRWSTSDGRNWKVGETHGCLISAPEQTFETNTIEPSECVGSLDRWQLETRDGGNVLLAAGWSAGKGAATVSPDAIFLMVSGPRTPRTVFETFKVPRPDVNAHLGADGSADFGFSRLLPGDIDPGEYMIEIVHKVGEKYLACDQRYKMTID